MRAFAWVVLLCASLFAPVVHAYDERWPDYGVVATDRGNSGAASYFQGFESPCFGPPYQPGAGETDWIRYYSEVGRVGTGAGGIASRNGFNHAEIRPPLPSAPVPNTTGAYSRLGGYRTAFGGGFTVELDVYFDLNDPRVLSGINADYGWDLTTAVNNQAGAHRRDFMFHTASNTTGQILVGASNVSNFAPIGNLASGPHYVVTSSGWYTLQFVYRDNGGTLAVDLNFRSSGGTLLFTRTLSDPSDLIASQIGGNRYLWFTFMQSNRLAIDNARLNSVVREALYASAPVPGASLNAGSANIGTVASGATLNVQNQGALRLEICSCAISGPAAGDFTIGGCPALIDPGLNFNLTVGCTPSAAGTRNASVTVVTNDSTRGTNFSYPLVCNGLDPNAVIGVPVPTRSPLMLVLLALLLAGVGAVVVRLRGE